MTDALMMVELLGVAIFVLTSLFFFWVSRTAGQGVAMTIGFGRFAFSKQVPTSFRASGWNWRFLMSLLLTAICISLLVSGGARMFYIALINGNAIVITCVAVVLSLCSAFFVRGFASFRGVEQ